LPGVQLHDRRLDGVRRARARRGRAAQVRAYAVSASTLPLLRALLEARLAPAERAGLGQAAEEVERGVDEPRFCALLSLASRYARSKPLAPSPQERARAAELLPGWDPERWTVLDAARVVLCLARRDLGETSGAHAL